MRILQLPNFPSRKAYRRYPPIVMWLIRPTVIILLWVLITVPARQARLAIMDLDLGNLIVQDSPAFL